MTDKLKIILILITIVRQMFVQVAKHNMLHHLTAEARKGYGSIIRWVFLA